MIPTEWASQTANDELHAMIPTRFTTTRRKACMGIKQRTFMELTNKQIIHREYLKSPLWKRKREEALAHYGPKCARCGEFGTDVHHKTYARVGGSELMTDLEILCRECHEAHHRVERATHSHRKRSKTNGINVTALYRYLTPFQRTQLQERFSINSASLYTVIIHMERSDILDAALKFVGKKHAFIHARLSRKSAKLSFQKHHAKLGS